MKNFQSLKPKLEVLIQPKLAQFQLKIYEINNFTDFGDDVLQVLVEDAEDHFKPLDLDLLLQVNEVVSKELDQFEAEIANPYLLEVASAGMERQIKTASELQNAVNAYVYVELVQAQGTLKAFNGTVKSYQANEGTFTFSYFLKGQPKEITLSFDQLKLIRYAIKF